MRSTRPDAGRIRVLPHRPGRAISHEFIEGGGPLLTAEDRRLREYVVSAGYLASTRHVVSERDNAAALLMLVLQGEGTATLSGTTHRAEKGDLIYLPGYQRHSYGSDPRAGWAIRWVHFEGDYAHHLTALLGYDEATVVRPCAAPRRMAGRLRDLLALLRARPVDVTPRATAMLLGMLLDLRAEEQAGGSVVAPVVQAWERGEESLERMATAAGYSKYHFLRRFKAETGMTPWRYLTTLRMERAKQLLLDGRLSVKEVAARVGIGNANYFSRIFKEAVGVPPRTYQQTEGLLRDP